MSKTNKKKTYQKPTQEQIQYLHDKSKVHNTEKSTLNWIQKFQKYCSDVGLKSAAEKVNNVTELEVQLCEYFTVAEKGDGSHILSADKILISAENADIIADYEKYFLKRPVNANP
ncbi:7467_t:CDS:2, partial [Dentiscutata heterogama]